MDRTPAAVLAEATRALQGSVSSTSTMAEAAELTQRTIVGCDAAAISTIHGRRREVRTLTATTAAAQRGDELQYRAGEGPGLDAVWHHALVDVPEIASEHRWPVWAKHMIAESEYRSLLVCRLFTNGDLVGALSLYATQPNAFAEEARETAVVLAAQSAAAVSDRRTIEQLSVALASRTVVGQATGILMERYSVDAAAAFAVLTRLSSQSNHKLRDIAAELVTTGQLPEPMPDHPDDLDHPVW